ncbi:MAG: NAD(P)H-dependent flavin oxidoreductase YrpB (nitropropane dioxygenase family) [Hyphomicrobiaceae bacterium]|jgi:NAD(P)H-dependent flavin oxidoreductase YrpB (nitropropane dioxygenase family)
MKSPICDMLGIEFPLLAFSHCRDVVAEVTRAGGMGVLGAVGLGPEQLETELAWIDEQVDGLPYGVDLIIPNTMVGKDQQPSAEEVLAMIPEEHKRFADSVLQEFGIDASDIGDTQRKGGLAFGNNLRASGSSRLLEVAFRHPIKLIANALGVPPQIMLDMGKEHGVAVAALVGAKEHAIKQVQAGVDILVVSGTEAGGHCGEVSTMVLIPEVYEAIQPYGDVPILAAGGIVRGRQLAACMAMGAAGAWTGSMWLTTSEAETAPVVKAKMVAASSRETVRSRSRTGKYSRQLRSPWTDAWEAEGSPKPLPMPLQSLVSEPALARISKLAESGHDGARQLATYWVGQGVGLMNEVQSVRSVVYDFKQDFADAYARLMSVLDD